MATYYEQLQETINKNKEQLEKLRLEKVALTESRRAWTKENFEKESNRIDEEINTITKELDKNKEVLATTNLVNNYIDDLKYLTVLYNEEDDELLKERISEEINNKREFIKDRIDNKLPELAADELRNKYIKSDIKEEDSKVKSLEHDREMIAKALETNSKKISTSLTNMKNIFDEEREVAENDGPFATNEELDAFLDKYMNKKVEENKVLEEQKRQKAILEKTARILDKKIEKRKQIVREANSLNLTADEYENILNKVNKRDDLYKMYKDLGLTELKDLREKVLVPTKEEVENKKNLVKERLLKEKEEQNARAAKKALPAIVPIKSKELVPVETKKVEAPKVEVKEEKTTFEVKELTKSNIEDLVNEKLNKELNTKPVVEEVVEEPKKIEEENYGYRTVIAKLVEGLTPSKKDGKRYRAANIEVRKEFKKELHSGNYLYNLVHLVPAIIKLPIQIVRKFTAKFTYKKEARERMETIKNRLEKLSDKDLDILLNEYSNHVEQERFGTGLNLLINQRVNRYVQEKVAKINKDIEVKYKDLYRTMRELDTVDNLLRNKDLSNKEREAYRNYRKQILDGKANEVASVRKDFEDAKKLLSSGLHGFEENIKATETKMSYVGMRFAKDHDLDIELLETEAKYERAEKKAIKDGNDEMALRIFVATESLLSKNTKVEKSIFGNRSTGKKYYSPLAEQLDYRNDPFVRDIFTTVAVVGATMTLVNSLNNNAKLADQQRQIEEVNKQNDKLMESVNNSGEIIANKKGALVEGMKVQNANDSLNISNVLERKALDQSSEVHGGWSVGTNTYYNARSAAQGTYNSFYETTKNAITDITTKYSAGEISQQQAITLLQEVSHNSQRTLQSVVQESLPHLQVYARDHSQFNLSGIEDSMNYIVNNPDAIINMNRAMSESIELGEELANMSFAHVNTITSLPSSLNSSILAASGAAALAYKVQETVSNNKKQGKYGNSITDLVENYIEYQESLKEELDTKKSK